METDVPAAQVMKESGAVSTSTATAASTSPSSPALLSDEDEDEDEEGDLNITTRRRRRRLQSLNDGGGRGREIDGHTAGSSAPSSARLFVTVYHGVPGTQCGSSFYTTRSFVQSPLD